MQKTLVQKLSAIEPNCLSLEMTRCTSRLLTTSNMNSAARMRPYRNLSRRASTLGQYKSSQPMPCIKYRPYATVAQAPNGSAHGGVSKKLSPLNAEQQKYLDSAVSIFAQDYHAHAHAFHSCGLIMQANSQQRSSILLKRLSWFGNIHI